MEAIIEKAMYFDVHEYNYTVRYQSAYRHKKMMLFSRSITQVFLFKVMRVCVQA